MPRGAKLGVQLLCYEQLLDAQLDGLDAFAWPRLSEDDPCGLCYTSGAPQARHQAHACLPACGLAASRLARRAGCLQPARRCQRRTRSARGRRRLSALPAPRGRFPSARPPGAGTTGDPKGVQYSHRSNMLHALVAALPDALALSSNSNL